MEGGAMKKALLGLACLALLSVAAKPFGASLAVVSDDGTSVTFDVTALTHSAERDFSSLWVAAMCRDPAGALVSAEYHGVDWPGGPPEGTSGPFLRMSGDCTAFVWEFPDFATAISNTVGF